MRKEFWITDHCFGEKVDALVIVDTDYDGDKFMVYKVNGENGIEKRITPSMRQQLERTFIREHEAEYNEILLNHQNQ